eukprot:scaffold8396_cov127-Isochrysis_galbana.AAC.5
MLAAEDSDCGVAAGSKWTQGLAWHRAREALGAPVVHSKPCAALRACPRRPLGRWCAPSGPEASAARASPRGLPRFPRANLRRLPTVLYQYVV